jgi:hypothetical protein
MAKLKKMCKINEDKLKKLQKEILEEIKRPEYLCKKCLRVAKTQKLLCKPEKMVG